MEETVDIPDVNITFDVARSSSCVFKKCREKIYIHDYIRDYGFNG